ncbi:MAG: hypothetical protein MK052_08870 [Alphaproteobacteria bacterium]|nr:hypothetical protein [Alphaproteobacteria bacterium]
MGLFDRIKDAANAARDKLGLGGGEQRSAVLNEGPKVTTHSPPMNLDVKESIEASINHSKEVGNPVQSRLNGIMVFVDSKSDPEEAHGLFKKAREEGRKNTMTGENSAYARFQEAKAAFRERADVRETPEAKRDAYNPGATQTAHSQVDKAGVAGGIRKGMDAPPAPRPSDDQQTQRGR